MLMGRIEQAGDPWKVTDAKIRQLCSYITTDAAVAGYFGCTVERVARVRANMTIPTAREFRKARHCGDQRRSGDEPAGTTVHIERHEIEERGRMFLESLTRMLQDESYRLGLTYGEAVVYHVHGNDPLQVRMYAHNRDKAA